MAIIAFIYTTGYVDRGDPGAHDYTELTLNLDGQWNALDLSAIVPAGAKAVLIVLELVGSTIFADFRMRKHGNANDYAISSGNVQVVAIANYNDCVVAVDADRKIDYIGGEVAISTVTMVIKGWWL
ncbi:unnamed protein product [marine sediment metagenome]|uniref:Uncharacterized protein n=1 Tax=marine sediment metagenome TaxID=412755 RepID=X1QU07_9ZZZZ